ncbi:MAG: hypothetical protein JO339_03930 [Alphaproteobacteria bacterium]|nr:hypothetical protein [Alphaproteobacteria bacterium]
MFKQSRKAVSAVLALAVAGVVAGSWVAPASAAPGQVCYFGECGSKSAAPASGQSSNQAKSRLLSQHGSWKAVLIGQGAMIYDQFDNGAKFAILAYPEGKFGLLLSHPEWHLKAGQPAEMSIRIDGDVYKGKAVANENGMLEVDGVSKDLLKALYNGRKGRIEVGEYGFDMTNLADAAAAIDDVVAHMERASR